MPGDIPALEHRPSLCPPVVPAGLWKIWGTHASLARLDLQCVSTKPILYPILCEDIECGPDSPRKNYVYCSFSFFLTGM